MRARDPAATQLGNDSNNTRTLQAHGLRAQALHRVVGVAIAQGGDLRPLAALADGGWEDELERPRRVRSARRPKSQVVLELRRLSRAEDAVDHHLDADLDEALDPGDGFVVRGLAGAEDRGAGRRVMRMQRDDGALEAGIDGAARESRLREATAVGVGIPRHSVARARRAMMRQKPG